MHPWLCLDLRTITTPASSYKVLFEDLDFGRSGYDSMTALRIDIRSFTHLRFYVVAPLDRTPALPDARIRNVVTSSNIKSLAFTSGIGFVSGGGTIQCVQSRVYIRRRAWSSSAISGSKCDVVSNDDTLSNVCNIIYT